MPSRMLGLQVQAVDRKPACLMSAPTPLGRHPKKEASLPFDYQRARWSVIPPLLLWSVGPPPPCGSKRRNRNVGVEFEALNHSEGINV